MSFRRSFGRNFEGFDDDLLLDWKSLFLMSLLGSGFGGDAPRILHRTLLHATRTLTGQLS